MHCPLTLLPSFRCFSTLDLYFLTSFCYSMKEGKMDLKTGRIHWSTCPWFTSLSTHPFYYFTSYHFTLTIRKEQLWSYWHVAPFSIFYIQGIVSFLTTAAPFLVLLSRHKCFLLSTRWLWTSLLRDYNAHICPMLLVFTIYLTPIPMLTSSSIWPLISRKNFSSPDHHCSNSDSCLPPSPSYFCLKNCPMKLCITPSDLCLHFPSQVTAIYRF